MNVLRYLKWIWFYLKFGWWKMHYQLERMNDWFVYKWRQFKRRFRWFDTRDYDVIMRLGENRRLYAILRRGEPEVFQ